jgi:hypothetical protein
MGYCPYHYHEKVNRGYNAWRWLAEDLLLEVVQFLIEYF